MKKIINPNAKKKKMYMMGLKKLKTTDSRPILPFDRWGN